MHPTLFGANSFFIQTGLWARESKKVATRVLCLVENGEKLQSVSNSFIIHYGHKRLFYFIYLFFYFFFSFTWRSVLTSFWPQHEKMLWLCATNEDSNSLGNHAVWSAIKNARQVSFKRTVNTLIRLHVCTGWFNCSIGSIPAKRRHIYVIGSGHFAVCIRQSDFFHTLKATYCLYSVFSVLPCQEY